MSIYGYRNMLNEALVTDISAGNKKAIIKKGSIPMYDETLKKTIDVDLKQIVKCVDRALGKIGSKYTFMFKYIENSRPIFVLANPSDIDCIHKTMAVDTLGNLYLNVHFIYNDLDCDPNKVFGILFHELMHNFLKHGERGDKILPAERRKQLYDIDGGKMLWMEDTKQNLCADYEVNCDMVADGVVTADFWKEMHGMYADEYVGMMMEDIYKKDGDKILKKYLNGAGKLSSDYLEAMRIILKCLRIINDKNATDRDLDIARAELERVVEKLFGEKDTKETIKNALLKIQKTRLKEIGEIGPYLDNLIQDFDISPVNMNADDMKKFENNVTALKDEMLRCKEEIAADFEKDVDDLERDITTCMDSMIEGAHKLQDGGSKMPKEERKKITDYIIFKVKCLLADDNKKKRLDEERKKKEKEEEEIRKKEILSEVEKSRRRHILYTFWKKLCDLSLLSDDDRLDVDAKKECDKLASMVSPLLSIETEDLKKEDYSAFPPVVDKLTAELKKTLMRLKKEKVLWDRDEDYFDKICGEFDNDVKTMFDMLTKFDNISELGSYVKIAISSLRRIGGELHRQAKVRPSKDYKEAYDAEYKRLLDIYKRLGKKGVYRELGILPASSVSTK